MRAIPISPNPRYFAVHGEGVGGKAGQLILKCQPILDAGFLMERRNVLGWSFFSDFLRRCGAEAAIMENKGQASIVKSILGGEFSEAEKKTIEQICHEYSGHRFLAVRSSAEGDALGTGIYQSYYSLNLPDAVERFVKKVFASHLPQAPAFSAGTPALTRESR